MRLLLISSLIFLIVPSWCHATAPEKLSQTGLYRDISRKEISDENRFYAPQYPLWSDGAVKKRWIFLPPGAAIQSHEPDHWIFPVGTKIWKEFSFAAGTLRRVETRFLHKTDEKKWDIVTYLWNQDESDATLAPKAGIKNYYPIDPTTKHDIPSVAQCLQCHQGGADQVLGFEALQLSQDRDPLAPNPERRAETPWTLKDLILENRLTTVSPKLMGGSPRVLARFPLTRASLGYLHANCGTCHNPQGSARFSGLWLNYPLGTEPAASPAFATALNQKTKAFAIPGHAETYRIKAGDIDSSALIYRMQILDWQRMPQLGSKRRDEEALKLLSRWIKALPGSRDYFFSETTAP